MPSLQRHLQDSIQPQQLLRWWRSSLQPERTLLLLWLSRGLSVRMCCARRVSSMSSLSLHCSVCTWWFHQDISLCFSLVWKWLLYLWLASWLSTSTRRFRLKALPSSSSPLHSQAAWCSMASRSSMVLVAHSTSTIWLLRSAQAPWQSWVWCSSSVDSVSRFRLCLSTSGQLIHIRVLLQPWQVIWALYLRVLLLSPWWQSCWRCSVRWLNTTRL